MRIIHVCYHDIRGGAALAARRLHLELLRTGHESRFMLVEQSGDTEQAIRLPALFRCRCRIEQRLEALAFRHANRNRLTPQSLNLFPTSIAARINRENPDVVNLHWINGASSAIWDLPRIHAPVVWTLHDTWPYCATEHYHDNNDLRFVTGYREPAPNGSFWQPLVWKCKRKNWNGWTPEIVAPSNWIAGEAQSSELMHRLPITPIANGVDLAVFRPSDRLKARQTLRLPPDARIILFGAYNAADRNKGGPELTAALRRLSRRFSEPLLLLAVGSNTEIRYSDRFHRPPRYRTANGNRLCCRRRDGAGQQIRQSAEHSGRIAGLRHSGGGIRDRRHPGDHGGPRLRRAGRTVPAGIARRRAGVDSGASAPGTARGSGPASRGKLFRHPRLRPPLLRAVRRIAATFSIAFRTPRPPGDLIRAITENQRFFHNGA